MTMFSNGPGLLEDVGDAIEGGLDRIAAGYDAIGRRWRRMRRAVGGIGLAFVERIRTGRPEQNTTVDPAAPPDRFTDPGLTGFLRALARAAARIDHDAALRKGETE